MPPCDCCNDSCPEIVPVTLNENSYTIEDNALDIALTVVDANTRSVVVEVQDDAGAAVSGYFRIKLWFVDTPTPTAEKSLIVPTTPGVDEWELVTDANGQLAFNIINTGALRTWYLCATAGVGIEISAAISIGT